MNTEDQPISTKEMEDKFPHFNSSRSVRIHGCKKNGLCLVTSFHTKPGDPEEVWWVLFQEISFDSIFPGKSVTRYDPPPFNYYQGSTEWARQRSSILHTIGDLVNAKHFGLKLEGETETKK